MASNRSLLLCGPGLALLAAVAACQSVAGAPAATSSAQFQCGPTDDVELALVIPAPVSPDESHGVLHVTLGSQQWSPLQRGAKTLTVMPGESARWCTGEGSCEQPDRLEFAFERVSLEHGGELAGAVEIQLDQRRVWLPVKAQVERSSQPCG